MPAARVSSFALLALVTSSTACDRARAWVESTAERLGEGDADADTAAATAPEDASDELATAELVAPTQPIPPPPVELQPPATSAGLVEPKPVAPPPPADAPTSSACLSGLWRSDGTAWLDPLVEAQAQGQPVRQLSRTGQMELRFDATTGRLEVEGRDVVANYRATLANIKVRYSVRLVGKSIEAATFATDHIVVAESSPGLAAKTYVRFGESGGAYRTHAIDLGGTYDVECGPHEARLTRRTEDGGEPPPVVLVRAET